MNPKCDAQGHLWGSWRKQQRRMLHVDSKTHTITRGPWFTVATYTVCLRTGCPARMDLEDTRLDLETFFNAPWKETP